MYCDPPYMHETRGRADRYEFEFSDDQHRELLKVVKRLRCRVMISGYWSQLYAQELKVWRVVTLQAVNRAGRRCVEHLWCNFPQASHLHDYRFVGANYRERERIKRKKARWVRMLREMPVAERRALLGAISEAGL